MQPLVSIIVPIYNNEKFIKKCVNSILIQDYTNWETILIDDGSTDNSGSFCDSYAAADSRFRVIHKENGGVSSARNRGLEKMCGRYFCFIDGDDYVESDYISSMLKDIQTGGFDMSTCCLIRERETESNNLITQAPKHKHMNQQQSLISLFDEVKGIRGYIACKLFRSEIIWKYSLRFDEEQKYCEDLMFTFAYLRHCKSENTLILSSKISYHYVQHNDSVLHKRFYEKTFDESWYGWTKAYDKLLQDCVDIDKSVRQAIVLGRVMQCVTLIRVMASHNLTKMEKYKEYKKYVFRNLFSYLTSRRFSFRKRAGALLILIYPKA